MPSDLVPDERYIGPTIQVPRFAVGQTIFRRYILQKVLGRGGMGVVWLARDQQLEKLTALKVLPETLYQDQASLDALKRETKLGLNLAHPNIVRIYDFQQDENAAAISMEYVDGPTLSDLRITRPHQVFSVRDLLNYLDALCDALSYAHNRERVIHRDLKPRNLMLNSKAELKITDFGISRSITESLTMVTGKLGSAGSPPYISPQQWDGERPTALDDIYSVGATLYELLSSKPPLVGVVDWQQVHHRVPPPIWQRRLDLGIDGAEPVPAQWEETIAACLAKEPKDRPQTIRELQARLTIDRPIVAETLSERPRPSSDEAIFIAKATLDSSTEPSLDERTLPDVSDAETVTSVSARRTVASRKRFPVWIWASCAALLLLCSLIFFLKKPGPPPLKGRGDVMIETEPDGAKVILDQGPPATAPHTFKSVKFGPHRLSITLEGYLPIEKEVDFEGVTLPKIVLQSKPSPREEIERLSVRSEPPGAVIRLDGMPPQELPNTFIKVKFGKHKLTALLAGYEPREQELIVERGTATEIVLRLEQNKPTPTATLAPSATPKLTPSPTPKPTATPTPRPTPAPTQTPDPLEGLIEEVKGYETTQAWPKHHRASLSLVRRLTTAGEPASTEHKDALQIVMEGLRTKGPALNTDEFRAYEGNIRTAAHLDIMPAILILADNLRIRNSPEAFNWYHYAAETRHNPEAMTRLGWIYFGGECGQQVDRERGFKWFKLAHELGSTEIGTVVASCYLRGDGTAKDEDAAIRILVPLADAGVAHAKTLVGQCYYNSVGQFANLRQDERDEKAKEYFEQAIAAGDWVAYGHLGILYESGRGVPEDWKQAVKLYLQGVAKEDPICMYYYARAIERHGAEIRKIFGRHDKAESYYKKAAAASVRDAMEWCVKHHVKF